MNLSRNVFRAVAVTFLTGSAALGVSACSGASAPMAVQATGPAPAAYAAASAASSSTAADMTIHIRNYGYSKLEVPPGATVTVMNMDGETHTVTADDKSFDVTASGGQSVTFTAPSKPGTYTFFCKYHSNMHGTLTVK